MPLTWMLWLISDPCHDFRIFILVHLASQLMPRSWWLYNHAVPFIWQPLETQTGNSYLAVPLDLGHGMDLNCDLAHLQWHEHSPWQELPTKANVLNTTCNLFDCMQFGVLTLFSMFGCSSEQYSFMNRFDKPTALGGMVGHITVKKLMSS